MNKTGMRTAAQRQAERRHVMPTSRAAKGDSARITAITPEQLRAALERQRVERLARLRLRVQSAIVDLRQSLRASRPRRAQEL